MNKYWRNKFWNEYGVKVKTYRYWDLWGFNKFYILIVYKGCSSGSIGELLTDKLFTSPESIQEYLESRQSKKRKEY